MELVIAEKPSVARDLARVLGVRGKAAGGDWLENDRYAITWCIGHLVELDEPAAYAAAWKPWRLDRLPMLPAEFKLRPAGHATKQLKVVKALLRDKRFSAVINACDAGREGELIFRYVYQYTKSRLPVRRLWISSLTDDAIRRGFGALRPARDLDALADAARSRSEADWLVGLNATRAVTVKSRQRNGSDGGDALFSIGRVQTPTLALLVAREHAIRTFVPRRYWEVRGQFRTHTDATFSAPWRHGKLQRLATQLLADAIVERDRAPGSATDDHGPRVVKVRSRTVREPAPQLFDLTSLQRTANRRFGFSAARTLELAQALYERHKAITYPRTDSRHLSSDVAKELPALFASLAALPDVGPFAQQLVAQPPRPSARIVDDSKVSDHHAIIPTPTTPRGALDRDEARLYDLIVRRFLGAFFPDAEIAVTEAWIRVGPGSPAGHDTPDNAPALRETFVDTLPPLPDHYLARGRVRVVAGWQEVAGIDADQAAKGSARDRDRDGDRDEPPASALPPLVEGQRLSGTFATVERETTPPPRYTEGALLAAMELAGKSIDDETLRAAMKDIGLGTPATRAAIIETLLRRGYIVRDRQSLVPTPTGIGLIAALEAAQVGSLASPELTGSWEARLAAIARGSETREEFMADIARYVTQVIDAIRGATAPIAPPPPPAGTAARSAASRPRGSSQPRMRNSKGKGRSKPASVDQLVCPRCKQGRLMQGQRGWGCSRWRDGCRFVVWFQTAGRRLTETQLVSLITSGTTRKAKFVDATGNAVDARLVLDPESTTGVRLQ